MRGFLRTGQSSSASPARGLRPSGYGLREHRLELPRLPVVRSLEPEAATASRTELDRPGRIPRRTCATRSLASTRPRGPGSPSPPAQYAVHTAGTGAYGAASDRASTYVCTAQAGSGGMASGARDRPHRPGTATLKFRKATLNPRPAKEVGAPAGHPPLPAAGLAQPSPHRGTSPGPKGRQAYLTLQADLHGINCRHFVAAVLVVRP